MRGLYFHFAVGPASYVSSVYRRGPEEKGPWTEAWVHGHFKVREVKATAKGLRGWPTRSEEKPRAEL